MTTIESEIRTISANNEVVFAKLGDLRNLEVIKDKIPAEAGISDFSCEEDSINFTISAVGRMSLKAIDREPFKTIKLGAENSPIDFNLWIQLVPTNETETAMRVVLKAELPMMVKMMLGNKLQEMVDQLAKGFSN
jgi:carbon monoxide dehydrogenase subunit G